MNGGYVNITLLNKDIEKIKFYAEEEKRVLTKICKTIDQISDCYNSNNTLLIVNSLNNIENNIENIQQKRLQYVDVVERVIELYDELTNQTEREFGGAINNE